MQKSIEKMVFGVKVKKKGFAWFVIINLNIKTDIEKHAQIYVFLKYVQQKQRKGGHVDRLNGMSLFSGIGGIDIALKDWVRTCIYCELDTYCQCVLLSRMQDGNLDRAPIWNDIKTLRTGEPELTEDVDIIFGGFP